MEANSLWRKDEQVMAIATGGYAVLSASENAHPNIAVVELGIRVPLLRDNSLWLGLSGLASSSDSI